MKEIIITITDDCEVIIEAKGFTGKACLKATKPHEEALGTVVKRDMKPEANSLNVAVEGSNAEKLKG